ncbi:MAG TPA: alkaline phosphatase D family protein [Allosphingosinicella sp.]|nr:alkaline phosphatase D family protein [Allosphingosinicella sp.]
MSITRRSALGLMGSAAVAAGCATPRGGGEAAPVRFDHGVASGDPAADGAILWTRASPADESQPRVPLRWIVSLTENGRPVRSGDIEARAARDFTAKAAVQGLRPGMHYWYRFEAADGTVSPSGRFRTLPLRDSVRLSMAVASCQLYSGGYFNAFRAISELPDLDLVLHLGDYIYEYGSDYGPEIGAKIIRLPDPPHEAVTLVDYRRRHAQCKRDPDLQAAHARAAFVCVWDDHEVADDSWSGGSENHQPAEGEWSQRKAAAMQAYFEWMPIRDPAPGRPYEAIRRTFRFGGLATLVMLESRLLARDKGIQVPREAYVSGNFDAVIREKDRPDREMIGGAQREWLEAELGASKARGEPWQIIGNQVLMARVAGPDFARVLGAERFAAAAAALPEALRGRLGARLAGYRAGLPFSIDSWDGYPAERERVYAAFAAAGSVPLVLTGDSHAFWANNLHDARGRLAARELGTTAVTSPSYADALPALPTGEAVTAANAEVVHNDQRSKGFIHLIVTPERAEAAFVAVSTIHERAFQSRVTARFEATPSSPAGPVEPRGV